MSITSSIELAMSGLRATQAGMDVVSQNVANAGTAGYTRRVLNSEQRVSGGATTGVDVAGATRMLDQMVQRQLRLEQAGASYTAATSTVQAALAQMFDRPGGTGSLPTLVNTFTTSLQALANNPSSYTGRSAVLAAASDLAATLNSVAGQVADLRQSTESAIGAAVGEADGLLQSIATLNARVVANPGSAALQDQRDALVERLSGLMDVKVTRSPTGSIAIATTGGLQLFDGQAATRLSFDAHAPLGPAAAYDVDPAKRGVGTITATDPSGGKRDVLAGSLVRSGEIAAQIDARDRVLVAAQAQLDELAAGLAAALSDRTVGGTAATAGAAQGFDLDLSGLQAGNAFTVEVGGPGGPRSVTFVKATSAAGAAAATSGDGRTVGIDFTGGMAAVASRVAAALGAGYAVSNPAGSTLRILDDGAAGTTNVTGLSGQATVTGLSAGSVELPLFVDGGRATAAFTGSFEGGSQRAGFAARIAINPAAVSDPSALVVYGAGILPGDATRPLFLYDRLTGQSRSFSAAAAIGGSDAPFSGSVTDFARRVVESRAADASSAATLDSGQQVVLNAVKSRFADDAGVNIDTELTQLIQLQTAYGANARVLTAAKDMMDMLLRIAG